MSVTPGRETFLQLGIGEVVLTQQSWTLQRDAKDMRPLRARTAVKTRDVFCTGGDAWILRPQFAETIQALTQGGYVQPADVELAPGMASFDTWRKRTDLSGADPNAGLPTSGAPRFQKRVSQAEAWNDARLDADEAALPAPPVDASQSYPLDRVLAGLETFPENTPFALVFTTPEGYGGSDALLNFYFGGETETRPDLTSGGQFCLTLQGSGDAFLWEHDSVADDWREEPVETFRWNAPGEPPSGQLCVLAPIPYAKAQIWFAGPAATPYSTGGFLALGALTTIAIASVKAQTTPGTASLYRESLARLGHLHTTFMSGAGVVRIDIQRTWRAGFSIIRGVYPIASEDPSGVLADGAFEINRYLPADTALRVKPITYLYPNTAIEAQLYNAADNTPLALHPDNPDDDHPTVFRSVLGQRKYYAVFTFTSTDGIGTPVLYGYSVDVEGAFTTQAATPLLTNAITNLRVVGPGLEPTYEQANVTLRDLTDATGIVREIDRIRTLISIRDTVTDDVITHLMEGETSQAPALQRGTPGTLYPSPDWHDTDLRMTGLWPRLMEQIHDAPMFSFASSDTGPTANIAPDPLSKAGFLPWKVTDVIRWLLNHAGVPADELDVPNLDLRFWSSEKGDTTRLAIYPGARYGEFAADLVKNYLGAVLLRDPNAGVRGMWRVITPPSPISLNTLWRFSRDPPPSVGKIVTYPGAYGASTSFILDDTWQTTPQAPEASVVTVYGMSDSGLITATVENPAALAYLNGRRVPLKRNDSLLTTQAACNWIALRLNEAACTPRLWFDFTAPLVFVRDTQDPLQNVNLLRPLRVFDLIYIRFDGVDYRAILRSVNPGYHTDQIQMAHYQGRMYPV